MNWLTKLVTRRRCQAAESTGKFDLESDQDVTAIAHLDTVTGVLNRHGGAIALDIMLSEKREVLVFRIDGSNGINRDVDPEVTRQRASFLAAKIKELLPNAQAARLDDSEFIAFQPADMDEAKIKRIAEALSGAVRTSSSLLAPVVCNKYEVGMTAKAVFEDMATMQFMAQTVGHKFH